MGKGQQEYDLMEDLAKRKSNITFGQLISLCPKLKKDWRRAVNPEKREPRKEARKVCCQSPQAAQYKIETMSQRISYDALLKGFELN